MPARMVKGCTLLFALLTCLLFTSHAFAADDADDWYEYFFDKKLPKKLRRFSKYDGLTKDALHDASSELVGTHPSEDSFIRTWYNAAMRRYRKTAKLQESIQLDHIKNKDKYSANLDMQEKMLIDIFEREVIQIIEGLSVFMALAEEHKAAFWMRYNGYSYDDIVRNFGGTGAKWRKRIERLTISIRIELLKKGVFEDLLGQRLNGKAPKKRASVSMNSESAASVLSVRCDAAKALGAKHDRQEAGGEFKAAQEEMRLRARNMAEEAVRKADNARTKKIVKSDHDVLKHRFK